MSESQIDKKWDKWRNMTTPNVLAALKNTYEIHKFDIYLSGQTQIAGLCAALIPKVEKLMEYERNDGTGRD